MGLLSLQFPSQKHLWGHELFIFIINASRSVKRILEINLESVIFIKKVQRKKNSFSFIKFKKKKFRKLNFFLKGDNRIWTGDRGVADLCLTTWLCRLKLFDYSIHKYFRQLLNKRFMKMTPTGIEPVLPPWKGDVLTAWPWSQNKIFVPLFHIYKKLPE